MGDAGLSYMYILLDACQASNLSPGRLVLVSTKFELRRKLNSIKRRRLFLVVWKVGTLAKSWKSWKSKSKINYLVLALGTSPGSVEIWILDLDAGNPDSAPLQKEKRSREGDKGEVSCRPNWIFCTVIPCRHLLIHVLTLYELLDKYTRAAASYSSKQKHLETFSQFSNSFWNSIDRTPIHGICIARSCPWPYARWNAPIER